MAQDPRLLPTTTRKLLLAVHIVFSVGWIGVDAVLLFLGTRALASNEPEVARASYPVMAALGTWIVTPAALVALVTGIVLGAGTRWGLRRHYWVLISLLATAAMAAAAIGLLNPRLRAAAAAPLAPEAEGARIQVVVASSVALVLLCAVNTLNVYKPRGRTRWYARSAGTRRDVVREPSLDR